MRRYIQFIGLMLVLMLLTNSVVMSQVVQFKTTITFSIEGSAPDSAVIGINSGDGIVPPNTYFPDLGDEMGQAGGWRELAAPPLSPPMYGIRAYLLDIRPYTWPKDIMLRPYDFHGFDGTCQTDTFRIMVLAGPEFPNEQFPEGGLTISWSNNIAGYAARWQLLKRVADFGPPIGIYVELLPNMETCTSYTDKVAYTKHAVTYLIIKHGVIVNGVKDPVTTLPTKFELEQNYPNPFNPTTEFKFTVAKKGRATLQVFNTLGQEVMNLFDGTAEPGKMYQVSFDGRSLASGTYFYRLTNGNESNVRKMILLK